ncbi:MAG: hypothetical protein JXB49_18215, partial [Bacteroidales bacterium]|nr:hypothetical protein [Bacteroidales bacterium]
IILDEWQVMPNHIHLIIELGEYNYNNGIANVDDDNVIEIKQYRKQRRKMFISKMMGKLKMKTPRLT